MPRNSLAIEYAHTKGAQPATTLSFGGRKSGHTFKDFKLGKPKRHKGQRFTFEHNIERDKKLYGNSFPHIRKDEGNPKFTSDHGIAEDVILGNEAEGGYGQYSGILNYHPISKAYHKSHQNEIQRGHHKHRRDPLHTDIRRRK